jgi:transposase
MLTADGLSLAEASRRLGVKQDTLRVWRDAAARAGDAAFPGPGNLSAEQEELRSLRAEAARLRAERDLLKKAAAYFACPPG